MAKVDAFLTRVTAATRDLVIAARKGSAAGETLLDLETHLNQYLRSYLPPTVPHIKLEPSALCDVRIEEGTYTANELGKHVGNE